MRRIQYCITEGAVTFVVELKNSHVQVQNTGCNAVAACARPFGLAHEIQSNGRNLSADLVCLLCDTSFLHLDPLELVCRNMSKLNILRHQMTTFFSETLYVDFFCLRNIPSSSSHSTVILESIICLAPCSVARHPG